MRRVYEGAVLLAAVLAAVGGVRLAVARHDANIEAKVRLAMRADSLVRVVSSHRKRADSLELALQRQLIVVQPKAVERWRVIKATPLPPRVDSVPYPVEVEARVDTIVEAADAVISSCTMAVMTCTELVAAKDSIIHTQALQLQTEQQRRPSRWKRVSGTLTGFVVGALAISVLRR